MSRILPGLLAVLALSLAACETPREEPAGAADGEARAAGERAASGQSLGQSPGQSIGQSRITGSLTYQPLVALPVNAVAVITVYEAGPADPTARVLAEERFALNGRQVPIPFQVSINWDDVAARGELSLRAELRSGGGDVLWTTENPPLFELDPGKTHIGPVRLSPTSDAVIDRVDLAEREWVVASVGAAPLRLPVRSTIRFDANGALGGQAPCNAYTGSFTLNEGALSVGPLALTRKACAPDVMAQERAFISVLETASNVWLDDQGLLTLANDSGGRITAR